MATKKIKTNSGHGDATQDNFLTAAAKSIGHAAGAAATAIGLEVPQEEVPQETHDAVAPKPKLKQAKPAKHTAARARRKTQAEEAKTKAAKVLKKAASSDVPLRRTLGKPAGNWTEKDIEYVNGLVAKHAG